MGYLKGFLIIFVVQALAMTSFAASAKIKSFKEWKLERISEARNQSKEAKNQLKDISAEDPALIQNNSENKGIAEDSNQRQWSIEAAKELTVTDYLVLYLSNQSSTKKYKEAAHHLGSDEIAEIMEAYARSVNSDVSSTNSSKSSSPLPIQADQGQ